MSCNRSGSRSGVFGADSEIDISMFFRQWQRYIDRQKPEYLATPLPSCFESDLVVVIPCYDEPGVNETLDSLRQCDPAPARVSVLLVFNSGERSDDRTVHQNRISYNETMAYARENNRSALSFFPLLFERLPRKHAGVGLARKIGMDLAVSHFFTCNKLNGVIVSLDADCTVSSNFLTAIRAAFIREPSLNGTIHNFRHRTEHNDDKLLRAVQQYEAYIRYFSNRLKWCGFPYYYHTIGSAFAVSADAYVRTGGMGRQQGGEDFYFLQKLFGLGHIRELNDAFVYPLTRFSNRIPFGTGPALQKIMAAPDGIMQVYSRDAFLALQQLFARKETFYRKQRPEIIAAMKGLHPSIIRFILDNDLVARIEDCNANSASLNGYQKRFFHHFNAFRIIKYLNFAHPDFFPLEKITEIALCDDDACTLGNLRIKPYLCARNHGNAP